MSEPLVLGMLFQVLGSDADQLLSVLEVQDSRPPVALEASLQELTQGTSSSSAKIMESCNAVPELKNLTRNAKWMPDIFLVSLSFAMVQPVHKVPQSSKQSIMNSRLSA